MAVKYGPSKIHFGKAKFLSVQTDRQVLEMNDITAIIQATLITSQM